MPIGSKQGACSSNTQTAKANCLKHNRREQVPGYVNPSLSHLNRIVFEDDLIKGRKSITPLVNKAEKLYTEKVGQKVQKSFAPFRESCLVVKPDTTDKQLMQFARDAEKLLGWKCIGVYMHLDEGHSHSKYIEGDDQWHVNAHAHVLWSCQDQNTGKILRPTRDYYRKMQDLLANATGMERGNSAIETGKKHRASAEEREYRREERARVLAEREAKNKHLKAENAALQVGNAVKKATVAVSDGITATSQRIAAIFGMSDKDKKIEALQEQLVKAVEDAKVEERKAVIQEIKDAALLHIGDGGNETAEDIGKAWRRNFDTAKERKATIEQLEIDLGKEQKISSKWYNAWKELNKESQSQAQEQTQGKGFHR